MCKAAAIWPRRGARRSPALAVLVLVLVAPLEAPAATISAIHGGPIRFALDGVSGDVLIELDGIDVTRWARLEEGGWVLDLPSLVEVGDHRLDAFEIDAEGRFRQRGSWELEIRRTERMLEASGVAGLSVEALHRVRDRDVPNTPDRTTARGSAYYEGRFAEGPWSAEVYAPMLYDSEGSRGQLSRRFDPTDYRLGLGAGPLSGEIGHHSPGPSSLVLQGFHRRGISTHLDSPFRTRLSTFVFRTDSITGFRESFGLTDEDRRTLGATLSTEPLPIGIGELEVAGTYLDSTGDESGAGVGVATGADAREEGQAYAVSLDARFFERRVRLRAEYARTRFDFDGSGGARPVKDTAYAFLASLDPWPNAVVLGQPFQALLSWEEQEVGTFFRSLGNAGAPTDLWTRRYGVDLFWAGLALNGAWMRARDNRDDEELQITYRSDDVVLDASYTPHWLAEPERPDWTRWLGTPTVSARWSRFRRKPLANDPLLIGFEDPLGVPVLCLDCVEELIGFNETDRLAEIGLGSRYGRWGWSASHGHIRFDDATGIDADTRTKLTSGDVDLRPFEQLTLQASFQRETSRARDPAFKTTRYLVGLGATGVLVPGRLDASVRVDWNKAQTSDRRQDERRTVVTAYANWLALSPMNRRPGLAVSLLGTYEDRIDDRDSSADLDAYQVFLKLELQWAARH